MAEPRAQRRIPVLSDPGRAVASSRFIGVEKSGEHRPKSGLQSKGRFPDARENAWLYGSPSWKTR